MNFRCENLWFSGHLSGHADHLQEGMNKFLNLKPIFTVSHW
jgi:hypothetical protein